MKNYKITVRFSEEEYSEENMFKLMSNFVAFSGYLYSLDYHGIENGAGFSKEDDEYILTIIVNNDKLDDGAEEIVTDICNERKKRKYKINKTNIRVEYFDEKIEIPEDYIEQYYANSYLDII